MNDEYLFNFILDYIFETGGCDDIGVMLKENCNVSLESERVHRLRRMLVASGYVEEDNYAYGNHPHLSITEAGTKFVMEKRKQESSAHIVSQKKERVLSGRTGNGLWKSR